MGPNLELNWMNAICKPCRRFLPERPKNPRDRLPHIWKKALTKLIKAGLKEKVTILGPDNPWDQIRPTTKPSWKPCVTIPYQPERISWPMIQLNSPRSSRFWKRIAYNLNKLICSGMRLQGLINQKLDCWMPFNLKPCSGRSILGYPLMINNYSSILFKVASVMSMKLLMLRVLKVRTTGKIQNLKLDNWTNLLITMPRTTMRPWFQRQLTRSKFKMIDKLKCVVWPNKQSPH
jgi:hypothetical protein